MISEKLKNKKRTIICNIILVAILFGLVSLNKNLLQPQFNHLPFVSILTGCFPNFIAAFIISLAFGNAIQSKKTKYSRILMYASSILVFLILAFEEIIPLWGASTQYDIFDIIASAIGSTLAILVFELTFLNPKTTERNLNL